MNEQTVKKHKVVSFTYCLTNSAGEVIEQNDVPMSYVHGEDQHIFEEVTQAMEGKEIGDEFTVTMQGSAFGEYDPDKTFSDSIENVPEEFQQIGAEATFKNEQGEQLTMRVVKIENGTVFMDGNHQFAGQALTFHIVIKDIRDALAQEIKSGQAVDISLPQSGKLH